MESVQNVSSAGAADGRCRRCGLPLSECVCHSADEGWRGLVPAGVALLLLLALMAIDHFLTAWTWPSGLRLLAYVTAYAIVGWPVIRNAFKEMRRGEVANEYFLMAVASLGAFAIGEYPEAVAVMLFYSVGEFFQDRAVDRARRDIRSLVNLTPETCRVVGAGDVVEKRCEDVVPGEVVEIVAGGRVPLDGTLLDRDAAFDTAALTGESMPRDICRGQEVQAGMVAVGGSVRLSVLRPMRDSALARIMAMVNDAAARKAPAERFIRKFARVYTPVVIALAALLVAVPLVLNFHAVVIDGNYTLLYKYVYRALIFLVISCPCAFVISIPLGYYGGIGAASRRGILFKGANYLDAITKVKAVMFDKTGTLTEGRFAVAGVRAVNGYTDAGVLAAVAALEAHSSHPIARAVVEEARRRRISFNEDLSVEEMSGMGMAATAGGHSLLAGNAKLMRDRGVETAGAQLPAADSGAQQSQIFCAQDRQLIGIISLADTLKPDARAAVASLRSEGIEETGILSGDKAEVTAAVGRRLGVDTATGDLLPEGKVRCLQQTMAKHPGGVAFVGDGINDAPCLALADVGIAMGGTGSDAAVETADVVIRSDRPSKVAEAVRIGRVTRRLVILNIVLALGVKVTFLTLGALGLTGLWWAVVADTGVALLCVGNVFVAQRVLARAPFEK
jgi:Cd2+/Zn2+-exporting ATPase